MRSHPDRNTGRRLMTVFDVAERCRVSARTVYRWIDDGLPVHRIPGSGARLIVRLSTEDLAEWLHQFRHEEGAGDDSQTIHLAGRRWIQNGLPSLSPNQGLDDRRRSRPGVLHPRKR